jgi:hypothetical protein
MADTTRLVNLGLHVVALLIGVLVAIFLFTDGVDVDTAVSLLAVGLAALALGSADV